MNPFLKSLLFEEATGEPAQGTPPPAAAAAAEPPKPEVDVAALIKERDAALQREREANESAKFWHSKARGTEEKKPAETVDNSDMLEIAAKGPAAMKAWLKSQGLVTKDEVEERVNAKAGQIVAEQRLMDQHPDLRDRNSEFHKLTMAAAVELKNQYPALSDIGALELAAERVSIKSGKATKPDDDDKQRRERAKAQGAEGTRRTRPAEVESDDLDEAQKMICEKLGVDPEAYKKRAKAGVQYARAT